MNWFQLLTIAGIAGVLLAVVFAYERITDGLRAEAEDLRWQIEDLEIELDCSAEINGLLVEENARLRHPARRDHA